MAYGGLVATQAENITGSTMATGIELATVNGTPLLSGDSIVISGGGAVDSVNGQTGVVVLDTDDVGEGSNLYFTEARVRTTPITGFSSGAGTVSATDTVLQAVNKLDGNVALKQKKASTLAVSASRSLNADDDGLILVLTNPSLTLTIPIGLPADFGCGVQPNGTTSFATSGGALVNGATTTLNRAASNQNFVAIIPTTTTDSYLLTGV